MFRGAIPVTVSPFFIILAILIGFLNSSTIAEILVWMGVVTISVLIHEYGHALTAVAFGQKARIELVGWGGLTLREGAKISLWKEFLIVLDGPIAGFLLGIVAFFLRKMMATENLLYYAFSVAIYVNFFWTIVNLLPLHPLDGGQLLRIVLESLFGLRGLRMAFFFSMVLAGIFSVFCFAFQALLAGTLFFLMGLESFRAWQTSRAMREPDTNTDLQNQLKSAEESLKAGEYESAFQQFEELRKCTGKGVIFETATEEMSRALAYLNRNQEAYDLLYPIKFKLSPESLRLLQLLAYRLENWKVIKELSSSVYQAFPNFETALINAMGHASLGEVQPAIGWLRCAKMEGATEIKRILSRQEFDRIRQDPAWLDFVKKSDE